MSGFSHSRIYTIKNYNKIPYKLFN